MIRILATLLLLIPQAAYAGPSTDFAFRLLTNEYARLKRLEADCDLPVNESVTFKARVLDRMMRIPNIDIIDAGNKMDRAAQSEMVMSSGCYDEAKENHATIIDNLEWQLERLEKAIIKEF